MLFAAITDRQNLFEEEIAESIILTLKLAVEIQRSDFAKIVRIMLGLAARQATSNHYDHHDRLR